MVKDNEILGYSRFTSKKGDEVLFVDVAKLPTDFDKRYGRVGMKVEQVWIPSNCFDKFNNSVIGKCLDAQYSIQNGRANVVDVSFK